MSAPSLAWSLAETYGLIPVRLQAEAAGLVASWWERPRTFGCRSARNEPVWTVVFPNPSVLCTECAVKSLDGHHCSVCGKPDPDQLGIWESGALLVILVPRHSSCPIQGAP